MIQDILCITVLVCFIVDISGFVGNLKEYLFHYIKGKKVIYREYSFKPFDCSLCMTWWSGLGYLFATGNISLFSVTTVGLFAVFAEIISYALIAIKDYFGKLINKVK